MSFSIIVQDALYTMVLETSLGVFSTARDVINLRRELRKRLLTRFVSCFVIGRAPAIRIVQHNANSVSRKLSS